MSFLVVAVHLSTLGFQHALRLAPFFNPLYSSILPHAFSVFLFLFFSLSLFLSTSFPRSSRSLCQRTTFRCERKKVDTNARILILPSVRRSCATLVSLRLEISTLDSNAFHRMDHSIETEHTFFSFSHGSTQYPIQSVHPIIIVWCASLGYCAYHRVKEIENCFSIESLRALSRSFCCGELKRLQKFRDWTRLT